MYINIGAETFLLFINNELSTMLVLRCIQNDTYAKSIAPSVIHYIYIAITWIDVVRCCLSLEIE